MFAQDPQRWTLPGARYVRAAAAGVDGTFVVTGLPAGSYYATATPAPVVMTAQGPADGGGGIDLENLDLLIPHAVRFDLRDGERRTVNASVD